MNELESKNQSTINDSFVEDIIKWFEKLMGKYTKGKYETESEKAFFSDESNLYNADGDLTPEYKQKIKEFEDYINKNDVSNFLSDVHSKDAEYFGNKYTEEGNAMLKSTCDFLDNQKAIVDALLAEKRNLCLDGKKFDFDIWFADYCTQHEIKVTDIDAVKNLFCEQIEDLLQNDEELCEWIKDNTININNKEE